MPLNRLTKLGHLAFLFFDAHPLVLPFIFITVTHVPLFMGRPIQYALASGCKVSGLENFVKCIRFYVITNQYRSQIDMFILEKIEPLKKLMCSPNNFSLYETKGFIKYCFFKEFKLLRHMYQLDNRIPFMALKLSMMLKYSLSFLICSNVSPECLEQVYMMSFLNFSVYFSTSKDLVF